MARKQIDQIILLDYKKHANYRGEIDGNHFILAGRNGAGKTSILQAMRRMLGISKENPEEPIRKGAEAGAVTTLYISVGGEKYKVEERFPKGGRSRLRFYKVENGREDEKTPAVDRLREVLGGSPKDFTPLISLEGKKQFEWLADNLGLDIKELENKFDAACKERTAIGREITKLQGSLKLSDNFVSQEDQQAYTEVKDAAKILATKKDPAPVQQQIREVQQFNEERQNIVEECNDIKRQIDLLQQMLAQKMEYLDKTPVKDPAPLQQELVAIQEHNRGVDAELVEVSNHNLMVEKVKRYHQTRTELEGKVAERTAKISEIEKLQGEINRKFLDLQLGDIVPGMQVRYVVDEETEKVKEMGLFLDDLPFNKNQHSYGYLLKCLVMLHSHFNKDTLNLIPIGEWNMLDEDNQREVLEFIRNNPELNVQLAIEKVDNSKEVITEIIEK